MRPLVARLGVLALVAAVACQAAQTPGPQPSTTAGVTTLRNRFGFYIHASQKITVKDSDVEFNIYGLHLQNSDDCVLVNNLLARQTYNSPGGYGLYLYASSRNRE